MPVPSRSAILYAFGAGVASAFLHAGSGHALVLALFVPLPLFMAGLGLGLPGVAIAGLSGFILIAISAGAAPAGLFLVMYGVPVALVVAIILRSAGGMADKAGGHAAGSPAGDRIDRAEMASGVWSSENQADERESSAHAALLPAPQGEAGSGAMLGHGLAWLAVYGMATFLVMALAMGERLPTAIESHIASVDAFLSAGGADTSGSRAVLQTIAPALPAMAVAWWFGLLIANGAFAQRVLHRAGKALIPTPAYRLTRLPRWLPGVTVAAALAALLGSGHFGFMAMNATLILCIAYGFSGLAVIHALSGRWPARPGLLGLVYGFVVILGWPAFLVVGLGFVDQWMGWRDRFAQAPSR